MIKKLYVLLFVLININTYAQIFQGTITSSGNNHTIPYVHLGIFNKNFGTVTDINGNFKLNLNSASKSDTLIISSIGYKSKKIPVSQLGDGKYSIVLEEDVLELREVNIQAKKLSTFTAGSKGVSRIMRTGWMAATGGERGVKINIKKPAILDKLHVHVNENTYDSALIRVHIRNIKDQEINEDIIRENIFHIIKEKEGWITIDLLKYDIILNSDFIVSIELVDVWPKNNNSGLFFSMNVPGKTFYYKLYSFSNWETRRVRSPSMYISASYINQ